MTYYQRRIAEVLEAAGLEGYDPRHIEAQLRLTHTVLSGMPARLFTAEVQRAALAVDSYGVEAAELEAQSFGL